MGGGLVGALDGGEAFVYEFGEFGLDEGLADHVPPDTVAWIGHEADVDVFDAGVYIFVNRALGLELKGGPEMHEVLVEKDMALRLFEGGNALPVLAAADEGFKELPVCQELPKGVAVSICNGLVPLAADLTGILPDLRGEVD